MPLDIRLPVFVGLGWGDKELLVYNMQTHCKILGTNLEAFYKRKPRQNSALIKNFASPPLIKLSVEHKGNTRMRLISYFDKVSRNTKVIQHMTRIRLIIVRSYFNQ